MGLCGKETKQVEMNIIDGNLIYDLFAYCPYEMAKLTSEVHACDLHEGQWGDVGSIICWSFKADGKTVLAKQKIVAKDDERKTIQFKVTEGQLLEVYKSGLVTIQTSNNSATISIEFEKINECMPDNPVIRAYVNTFEKVVTDIELNHQAIPRLATN